MSVELIIGGAGFLFTLIMLVLTIGSFLWMARSDYRHLDSNIKEMREEMKDFHTKLALQDAEFKAFMRKEEEKRTSLLLHK